MTLVKNKQGNQIYTILIKILIETKVRGKAKVNLLQTEFTWNRKCKIIVESMAIKSERHS